MGVNPVRNSSSVRVDTDEALDHAGIILKCNPSAEQWGIISNQKYLKFLRPVILNHALNLFHGSFQDLTSWIERDAEPTLSFDRARFTSMTTIVFENVRDKFSDFIV